MVSKIVLGADLVVSRAFLELTGVAPHVLLLFLKRRQMVKLGRKQGKEQWVIGNNGEIVFPYAEAENKFGITRPRFQRAIDQLVEKGFLDIKHAGGGMMKDTISERWQDYGTDSFIQRNRKKDVRGLGFKKKELKTGNGNITYSSNTNVT